MANHVCDPVLITGAAGGTGGVGRRVVEHLRDDGLPVRAMVHREDERAQALRDIGAEVVVGDLLDRPMWPRRWTAVAGCSS